MQTKNDEKKPSRSRKNWNVAELQVSYTPKPKRDVIIEGSFDAYRVIRKKWDKSLINLQEQFCALFLNTNNAVIGFRVISTGELTRSNVDVRMLLQCALACTAHSIVIAHNHPNGCAVPSRSDESLTKLIKRLTALLGIKLFDHLIITDSGYYSFVDEA